MPTRPSLPVVAALLLLAAAAPACAFAQRTADAAPLPFHPGQWGLSANIFGGEAAGIGALRFTAPNRALVLDVSASMNREKRRRLMFRDAGVESSDAQEGKQRRFGFVFREEQPAPQ